MTTESQRAQARMAALTMFSSQNRQKPLLQNALPFLGVANSLIAANQSAFARWAVALRPMQEAADRAVAGLANSYLGSPEFKERLERLDRLVRLEKQSDRLERIGWLPHDTSPFDLIDDSISDEQLGLKVEARYRSEWPRISTRLIANIERCSIDDDAKATFAEAVTAHGAGLFRCAPRLLYPEVERVVREEFHGGDLKTITSQHAFQKALGGLVPSELASNGMIGLRLYKKLVDRLYTNLKTQEAIEQASADPTPNRHAALHGLITYKTIQASFNAIAMTDYLLQAVGTLKALKAMEDVNTDTA